MRRPALLLAFVAIVVVAGAAQSGQLMKILENKTGGSQACFTDSDCLLLPCQGACVAKPPPGQSVTDCAAAIDRENETCACLSGQCAKVQKQAGNPPESRACQTDADCTLFVCAGCLSKAYVEATGFQDTQPCWNYPDRSCDCVQNACTVV